MEAELYKALKREYDILEEMIRRLIDDPGQRVEGKLVTYLQGKKYPQYYLRLPGGSGRKDRRVYLKRREMDIARRAAQQEYQDRLLNILEKRLRVISRALRLYETSMNSVLERMPEGKQALITPLIEPVDSYIDSWKKKWKTNLNSYEIRSMIYSENGEHMRSKSEKIIADKLKLMGIPYVYEPQVDLGRNHMVYPDFVILNSRTRRTFFYEHFGIMDDPEYSARTVEKIKEYEKAGYWFGTNLLYSFESMDSPLDSRLLEQMLTDYCL